jgi:YggT family protein
VITILYQIIEELLGLYRWVVILAVIFSLLASFGVLDTRNRFVWTIGDFLYRITEPALRPIRRVVPTFGSIDISPVILLVLIWFAQMLLTRIYQAIAFGDVGALVL